MRRHGFDPISLVFGAIFAGLGLAFLFGNFTIGSHFPQAWAWPIPLVIVGALIVLLAVRRGRPAEREMPPASSAMPAEPPDPLPWETSDQMPADSTDGA